MKKRDAIRLVILIVCSAIMILHRPWSLFHPEFYFEDGYIFNAHRDSLRAFITPYQGYYHTLPRMVAWMTSSAFLYAWLSFAGTIVVLLNLFSERIQIGEVQKCCMVLLASCIIPTEALFNVAYFQWILGIGVVTLFLKERPTTTLQAIGDIVLICIAGLSSVFVFILFPLFLFYRRDLLFVWLVTTIIQLSAVSSISPVAGHINLLRLLSVTSHRIIDQVYRIQGHSIIVGVLYGGLATIVLYCGWRSQYILFFVLIHLIFLVVAVPRIGEGLNSGERYYFFPCLMLLWGVVLIVPKK